MRTESGLTLIELMVAMGITLTLLTIGSLAFIKPQQKVNIDTVVNTLIADIKSQQTKAMSGDTASNYTIHFEENRYILDNFTVLLDENVRITNITFNNQDLVFQKGSGEVNFVGSQNSLNIINDNSDESVQISINKYGTIHTN